MPTVPDELRRRLKAADQEHVLAWWDQLDESQQQSLLGQLQELDFAKLRELYANRDNLCEVPKRESIQPITVLPRNDPDESANRKAGEEALSKGEVAVMLVAGGQGARLGFHHPKGMFPIGPVSEKTLYRIHAEKILATSRLYGGSIPFLVMTSHATHDETEQEFEKENYYGLPETDVHFFCQGTMPAMDLTSGRLLMESRDRLFLSPDGHGGMLYAFQGSGLLERMRQRGLKYLFYFQVDNPLVKVADPLFIGQHIRHKAEASSRAIEKRGPGEKAGVFASVQGKCRILEYSDIDDDMKEDRDSTGRLSLWAGNPAIHLFSLDFLARVAQQPERLDYHAAKKKVPYLDEAGNEVKPTQNNALKLEHFIFDVLPQAERWLVVEAERQYEFSPVKNADAEKPEKCEDSPLTARASISKEAATWLEQAGVTVPRQSDGSLQFPLEISPLFALDANELKGKVDPNMVIDGPTYLE